MGGYSCCRLTSLAARLALVAVHQQGEMSLSEEGQSLWEAGEQVMLSALFRRMEVLPAAGWPEEFG